MIELPLKIPFDIPKQDKRSVLHPGISGGTQTIWTNGQRPFSSEKFIIYAGRYAGIFMCYKFWVVVCHYIPLKIPFIWWQIPFDTRQKFSVSPKLNTMRSRNVPTENYYKKIQHDKKTKTFQELVIQIGSRDNQIARETAVQVSKRFLEEYKVNNPQIAILVAYGRSYTTSPC